MPCGGEWRGLLKGVGWGEGGGGGLVALVGVRFSLGFDGQLFDLCYLCTGLRVSKLHSCMTLSKTMQQTLMLLTK